MKIRCLILVLILCLLPVTVLAAIEPSDGVDRVGQTITLSDSHEEYTISGNGIGYAQYTANLTDGKWVDGLTYDNKWFGFCAGNANNTQNNR